MSKRILSALLAVLFLITGLPSTVWAVGEGNMEAGGGQTETVTGDSFWNGQWGIRFCVVDVVSQSVVSATYDASNYCQLHPGGGSRARDRRERRRPYRPDFLPKDRPGEI